MKARRYLAASILAAYAVLHAYGAFATTYGAMRFCAAFFSLACGVGAVALVRRTFWARRYAMGIGVAGLLNCVAFFGWFRGAGGLWFGGAQAAAFALLVVALLGRKMRAFYDDLAPHWDFDHPTMHLLATALSLNVAGIGMLVYYACLDAGWTTEGLRAGALATAALLALGFDRRRARPHRGSLPDDARRRSIALARLERPPGGERADGRRRELRHVVRVARLGAVGDVQVDRRLRAGGARLAPLLRRFPRPDGAIRATPELVSDEAIDRYRQNFQDEIDSAAQYRAMAAAEPDEGVARVYVALAVMEEKHAAFWEERLKRADATVPRRRPSWRARVLSWVARRFGAQMVLPTVATREYQDRNLYVGQPETKDTKMVAQEQSHARVLRSIMVARSTAGAGTEIARAEGRHRRGGGNALRAAVLGANDGLCSNLALIMGVAGASPGRAVLIAGLAGLVAGAFSMAFGEWISVTSSRELSEREIRVEQSELEHAPEEEREELQLIYESRGLPKSEAAELSARLLEDPKAALDVLAREELGIDPNELGGSPWTAAGTSFALFSFGAAFPLLPYFWLRGLPAIGVSAGVSALVLFLIGVGISVITGKSAWLSGTRQLLIGLATAGVTYGIGRALGVALG